MVDGAQFLLAKLPCGETPQADVFSADPVFGALAAASAASLCPVHALLPLIRRLVAPGHPLFQRVNRRNFNRQLKAIAAWLRIPGAKRRISHAYRRGATQELKESASPWSAIASSGIWGPPAFRGYFDMSRDLELGPNSFSTSIATRNLNRTRYASGYISDGNPLAGLTRPLDHWLRGSQPSLRGPEFQLIALGHFPIIS